MTSPPRDPDIAELARLDAEIASLSLSVQTARAAFEVSSTRLAQVRHQRATVAARLQDRYLAAAAAQAHAAAQAQAGAQTHAQTQDHPQGYAAAQVPAPDATRHAKHETSPRAIQTLLFILGGILLGSAAVVFTTVAWANVGVAGKAVILAGFTVLTLLVPPVVARRSLHGTAETFAALGLLLVLLDGYAAWYVNLAGLADCLTAAEYTGAVFAVTSALAAAYRAACRTLVGSRFIAIIAAQPVLPLLWADRGLGSAGWAVLLAAVAVADMAAVRYAGFTGGPARFGRQLVAGGCAGVALLVATQLALFGLVPADTVPAALRAGGAVADRLRGTPRRGHQPEHPTAGADRRRRCRGGGQCRGPPAPDRAVAVRDARAGRSGRAGRDRGGDGTAQPDPAGTVGRGTVRLRGGEYGGRRGGRHRRSGDRWVSAALLASVTLGGDVGDVHLAVARRGRAQRRIPRCPAGPRRIVHTGRRTGWCARPRRTRIGELAMVGTAGRRPARRCGVRRDGGQGRPGQGRRGAQCGCPGADRACVPHGPGPSGLGRRGSARSWWRSRSRSRRWVCTAGQAGSSGRGPV